MLSADKGNDEYFKIIYTGTTYNYEIYDESGNAVITDGPFPKSPHIENIGDNIIKCSYQAGTGISTRWTFYYDVKNDKKSDIFYSVFDEYDNMTVFSQRDKVVLKNFFDKEVLMEITEFEFPISSAVEPFTDIKFIDNGKKLEISYLSGEDFIERTQTFDIV